MVTQLLKSLVIVTIGSKHDERWSNLTTIHAIRPASGRIGAERVIRPPTFREQYQEQSDDNSSDWAVTLQIVE